MYVTRNYVCVLELKSMCWLHVSKRCNYELKDIKSKCPSSITIRQQLLGWYMRAEYKLLAHYRKSLHECSFVFYTLSEKYQELVV